MTIITPSFNLVPRPDLDPPGVSFTRSTLGWRTNANGLVEEIPIDTLRHDYDPVTGEYLGFLFGPAIVNNLDYGRDFTNAAWVKTNITALKNATGIDGVASSASTLTATANNGTAIATYAKTVNDWYFGLFIKRKTGAGTIEITIDNGVTWVDVTAAVAAAGSGHNGFARVFASDNTAAQVVGIRLGTSGDEVEVDGGELLTDDGLAPVLSSTAFTQQKDIMIVNDVSWLNPAAGTIFADFIYDFTDNWGGFFSIDDGTVNNAITGSTHGGLGYLQTTIQNSGEVYKAFDPTTGVNTRIKVAFAWELNNANSAFNGTLMGLDTAVTIPTGLTRLQVGADYYSRIFGGSLRQLSYFPRRLSDADLQILTA